MSARVMSLTSQRPQARALLAYLLFGLWIRLAAGVALVGGGLALASALPIVALQSAGVLSTSFLMITMAGEGWLAGQSTLLSLVIASGFSVFGLLLLVAAAGPARGWLLRSPLNRLYRE